MPAKSQQQHSTQGDYMTTFFAARRLVAFGAAAMGLFIASADVSAAGYTLTLLPPLTGSSATATAINNAGQVVGYSTYAAGSTNMQAVTWNGTAITALDTLGGNYSIATAINNIGQIAGWATEPGAGAYSAVVWNGTQVTTLAPPKSGSFAYGINDAGQVAGTIGTRATVWSNGTTVTFGDTKHGSVARAINNAGQVGGQLAYGLLTGVYQATVWNGTTPTDLYSGGMHADSAVYAINNAGVMVGQVPVASIYTYRPAVWIGGREVLLQALPNGYIAGAYAINNLNQVVGASNGSGNGLDHAVTWRGLTVIDLNSFLDADTVAAGWVLITAYGINDSGQIVGSAFNTVTKLGQGFLLTPTGQ